MTDDARLRQGRVDGFIASLSTSNRSPRTSRIDRKGPRVTEGRARVLAVDDKPENVRLLEAILVRPATRWWAPRRGRKRSRRRTPNAST